MTTNLGKVMVTPKGAWSSSAAYERLDIVTYGGGSYVAVQNVPAGTDLTNTAYWNPVAEKGDKGDKGDTGAEATVVQTTGTSVDDVMSQKAVTDALGGKASTEGHYTDITSGNADQLVATVGVEDKVPYNFRTSGGSVSVGNRVNETVVGGTVAWNQLVTNGNFESLADWDFYSGTASINDNVLLFTTNSNSSPIVSRAITGVIGHKYLIMRDMKASAEAECVEYWGTTATSAFTVDTNWKTYSHIFNYATGQNLNFFRGSNTVPIGTIIYLRNAMLFDLTKMFGATIANYIYSLEQSTAGAGVAWFKSLFPKPYYAYNAGELISVCTNAHKMVGFNAYNPATGTARLIGGKQYQITGAYTSLSYSTGETITPNDGLFTPTEDGFLTVTGGNATDTCVHLTWSGYRNGDYEPYEEHVYPLSPIELLGIPKLDAQNNLYYDGDIYEPNGTVTRKYRIVDLGSLSWSFVAGSSLFTSAKLTGYSARVTTAITTISSRYESVANKYYSNWQTYNGDKVVGIDLSNDRLIIKDSAFTSGADLKAALSGAFLIYELGTPTIEYADPYANPQIVNDFGTEEYVDALATSETNPRDVEIPVGHDSFYQANLRDKLQNLPSNAAADGLYLVKQTGGKQELISYVGLPDTDALDGAKTYALKVVSGQLRWEEEV